MDLNRFDDGSYEVAAHDLYEFVQNYFGPKIKVKQSFIVNKKRYTLATGEAQIMPISHSGLDLEKYANGKFLCKNEIPFHITIIRPVE
jgi:hypothetical protein